MGEWNKKKIQIIDTPGDNNFFVDARNALSVSDIAVVTISAVDGVQVMTEKMYGLSEEYDIPRLVVINKVDRERANFQETLDSARELLSKRIAPFIIPIGAEDSFKGVVNVLRQKAYFFRRTAPRGWKRARSPRTWPTRSRPPRRPWSRSSPRATTSSWRSTWRPWSCPTRRSTRRCPRPCCPAPWCPPWPSPPPRTWASSPCSTSSATGSPPPVTGPRARAPGRTRRSSATRPPKSPCSAYVFKTVQDKFTGSLTLARIWSGTLNADSGFYNATKDEKERFGQILIPVGKKQEAVPAAGPGDIIAIAKLKNTTLGDSLCDEKRKVIFPSLPDVNPIITYAIRAKDKNDEDKVGQALNRIAEEDPTIRVIRDAEVKETQIAGMGQVHIDTTIDKMRRKFDVEVELSTPRIPYRETIRKKVENVEASTRNNPAAAVSSACATSTWSPSPGAAASSS